MSDYLVHIDVSGIYALPEPERHELVAREQAAGRKLIDAGTLVKLWSVPGKKGNFGIWSADTPDELHKALQSLPIYPYATFEVHPLATHPLFA
jgi:muconolactone D-isomerase